MCRLLGVTKQAYYKHGDSDMLKAAQESFVVEFIKDIRKKDPGIGGNKLWLMYQRQFGVSRSVGYNRFYDIVEKYNLKVRKVKRRVKTTDSTHDLPLYPDIVKDLLPNRPCQLIVSDITYIPYYLDPESGEYKFCYLALITDYYTKEIVGYSVAPTLEAIYAIEALKMIGGDMVIKNLKDGVDEIVVEKGATLSQGQRQLISFARAMAHDPRILILDEATSSIDSETEQIIQGATEILMKGRTTFIIAHRLSTIKNADRIYLLEKGRVVEEGSHEELMGRGGKYYEMNKIQGFQHII